VHGDGCTSGLTTTLSRHSEGDSEQNQTWQHARFSCMCARWVAWLGGPVTDSPGDG
jgi:hypothetical protein